MIRNLTPSTYINKISDAYSSVIDKIVNEHSNANYFYYKTPIQQSNHNATIKAYINSSSQHYSYDSIKIFQDIALSRLEPQTDSISSIFLSYIDTVLHKDIDITNIDSLNVSLYPFEYIPNYTTLTMDTLSKLILTTGIDKNTPSDQFFLSSMYIYDMLHNFNTDIMNSSYLFSDTSSSNSATFKSRLNIQLVSNDTMSDYLTLMLNDLSNLLGSNSNIFYSNVSNMLYGTLSGSTELSVDAKFKIFSSITKSVSSILFTELKTYLTTNISTVIDNILSNYINYLISENTNNLYTQIYGSFEAILPTSERAYTKFIYDDYFENRSDYFDEILKQSAHLATNPDEYLEIIKMFHQPLLTDIDNDIEKFVSEFKLPTSLLFNKSSHATSDISNYIHTYGLGIDLKTTTNASLLKLAIFVEMTNIINSVLSTIYSNSSKILSFYSDIDSVILNFIDSNNTESTRIESFMSIVQISLNHAMFSSDSALSSFYSKLSSNLNYTSAFPIQNHNTLTWLNTYISNNKTSKTLSRAAICSFYSFQLNAYLDSFAT